MSCQTVPTKFNKYEQGKWDARILFKDLRKNKSQIVNAIVVAKNPDKFRLELISSLGQHLASIVKNGDTLQLLSVSDKTLFEGASTKSAFERATGVSLDPQLIVDALFDREPPGYKCEVDSRGYLASCQSSNRDAVKVEWVDREVSRKKILVTSEQIVLQMQLQGFSTEVQVDAGTFRLTQPDGYKKMPFPQKR